MTIHRFVTYPPVSVDRFFDMEITASQQPMLTTVSRPPSGQLRTGLPERDDLVPPPFPYKPLDEWVGECSQRRSDRGEDLNDIYVAVSFTW